MNFKTLGLLAMAVFFFNACQNELEPDQLVPLTVIEDDALPAITINGVKLHSETFGNPLHPMLVVLHGGPGGDYRGLLNFKSLANDRLFVVFYDQRGSGLSERISKDGFVALDQFVDELDGVINHYKQNEEQKVILAGHSWGAMLATAYVNQNPNAISGLILAEPGGFTWEQTEAYISRSRQLKIFDEQTNDFVYQDQFITASDHNTLDYKMALSTAGDLATGDIALAPYWRFGSICSTASIDLAINNPDQMNFTTNLSSYTAKVLFAYSERNEAYGLQHATLVSAAYPNVQLVKILGSGHEIPHYSWNNFYPLIQNYLIEIL